MCGCPRYLHIFSFTMLHSSSNRLHWTLWCKRAIHHYSSYVNHCINKLHYLSLCISFYYLYNYSYLGTPLCTPSASSWFVSCFPLASPALPTHNMFEPIHLILLCWYVNKADAWISYYWLAAMTIKFVPKLVLSLTNSLCHLSVSSIFLLQSHH